MRFYFDRYPNGNLKVMMEVNGCYPLIEVSKCLDSMPSNVAYIWDRYTDAVLSHNEGSKIYSKDAYNQAVEFAM